MELTGAEVRLTAQQNIVLARIAGLIEAVDGHAGAYMEARLRETFKQKIDRLRKAAADKDVQAVIDTDASTRLY